MSHVYARFWEKISVRYLPIKISVYKVCLRKKTIIQDWTAVLPRAYTCNSRKRLVRIKD